MTAARHTRDLTRGELRAFVAELAGRPQDWRHLVHHDPAVRTNEQLLRDEQGSPE